MSRDYRHVIASLRAKAADKATGPSEAKALRAKADEIERNHPEDMKADTVHSAFSFTITWPPTGGQSTRPAYDQQMSEWLDQMYDENQWSRDAYDDEDNGYEGY